MKLFGVNNIIITLVMILFSLFGAIFGMAEETIAFAVIFVPLSISMGYDSIIGVCLCYFAAHMGFAAAILNPFTVGIAQGLASVPLFTGIEYRTLCWIIITFVSISFVLWYAARIKKNPKEVLCTMPMNTGDRKVIHTLRRSNIILLFLPGLWHFLPG